jgi:hypothetical protein
MRAKTPIVTGTKNGGRSAVDSEPITVSKWLAQGELRLTLAKKGDGVPKNTRAIGMEPPLTTFDNSEARIRRAVSRKRRQGRTSDYPTILAIHANGISSSYEAFNHALFGVEVSRIDNYDREVDAYFKPNGEFTRGSGEPTWAAVLAFVGVGLLGGERDPVLYPHPRFRGELPESLSILETRECDPVSNSLKKSTPISDPLLPRLGFIRRQ